MKRKKGRKIKRKESDEKKKKWESSFVEKKIQISKFES